MIISAIVAMGKDRQIGLDNKLLWRLSDDFKLFKAKTMGHIMIMGRKTYESIGKPLPGRTTFILSATANAIDFPGTEVFSSLEDALNEAAKRAESEVFICGGGQLYKQALNQVSKLYLTIVDYEGPADTYFPELTDDAWSEEYREQFSKDEKNEYDFSFSIKNRIQ